MRDMTSPTPNKKLRYGLIGIIAVLSIIIAIFAVTTTTARRELADKEDEISELEEQIELLRSAPTQESFINEFSGDVEVPEIDEQEENEPEAAGEAPDLVEDTTPVSQPTPSTGSQEVQVFFSDVSNLNDFTATTPVTRNTDRVDVAAFVIESLLAGPQIEESIQGLDNPIILEGDSSCGGKDFEINLVNGAATLQFCRDVVSAGVGDDAKIQAVLNDNLLQFDTISSVVILDNNGDCLGDQSGENLCK